MPTTRTAFLAVVGLSGLLLTFYPTLFSGFERMQPEAGDVLLNNFFLEHSYRWAFDRDYPFSLWSPGFYYPTPYVFTYSETLIGTAPLYWLLRVWFSETVACQLWIIITYALNFASMAVVLRWFGVNAVLTAAGAYVFAFGLIRVDHLTHQHLMPQYFSPFAVWYAWAFLREPSARRWAMVLALCALQVLAGLHLGWFLGFGLVIFVCCGVAVEPGSFARVRQFVRVRPAAMVVPLLVAGVAVGMYARNFYKGTPSPRAYWEAAMYCPYPDGWFVATPGCLWADHLTPRHPDDFPEKALFQGFTVYAVFLAAGWYALRRQGRTAILSPLSASERGAGGERSGPEAPSRPLPPTPSPKRRGGDRGLVLAGIGTAAILAFLVTRWGYDVSLWFLVHLTVPGANAFRAVGRIAFAAYLFGLVGGLVGVQALVTERISRPGVRAAVFVAIAALMILEQVRPFPESFDKREEFLNRAESLIPQLRDVDAAYILYDEAMPDYRHEIAAMWAGLWAKTPVMNGFSGTQPPGYPGIGARPPVEELVRLLGPNWRGKLAVIEWGPPVRRRVYQVEPGEEPSNRFRRIE